MSENLTGKKGRVLFDVLTGQKDLKRIVARNIRGGYYACLRIYDENLDYSKIVNTLDKKNKILINISQPVDEETKKVAVDIPESLYKHYEKLSQEEIPEYPSLIEFASFIISLRLKEDLPVRGLEELIEKYREEIADQKRGANISHLSIDRVITDIAKKFEEENKLVGKPERQEINISEQDAQDINEMLQNKQSQNEKK
jgi:hypothetical protein